MIDKTIEALNFELKFIAWKIDSIRERKHNLARQHVELQQELEDMERHYERTAKVLDDLSEPKIKGEDFIYSATGEKLCEFTPGKIVESEWGSSQQVGILPGTMLNEDNEEMKCACGNKSVMMMAGRESYQLLCEDCAKKIGLKYNLNLNL